MKKFNGENCAAAKSAKDGLSTALCVADPNGRAFLKHPGPRLFKALANRGDRRESTGFPNQSTAVPGSRRATRDRVWAQVLTVGTESRAIAMVPDSDATLAGIRSGKTVKLYATSANDAGKCLPGTEVQVVVA